MKRWLVVGIAVVVGQAALVGVWLLVQSLRGADQLVPLPASVLAEPALTLDQPAPELQMEGLDGISIALSARFGEPLLVHFWATWCPPCREELPELLGYAEEHNVHLLAITVDPDWNEVRRFFRGEPPATVMRASGDAVIQGYGVETLPATFVVDADGRLRLRLDGARDWQED